MSVLSLWVYILVDNGGPRFPVVPVAVGVSVGAVLIIVVVVVVVIICCCRRKSDSSSSEYMSFTYSDVVRIWCEETKRKCKGDAQK